MPTFFRDTVGRTNRLPNQPKVIAGFDCGSGGFIAEFAKHLVIDDYLGIGWAEFVGHEFGKLAESHRVRQPRTSWSTLEGRRLPSEPEQ